MPWILGDEGYSGVSEFEKKIYQIKEMCELMGQDFKVYAEILFQEAMKSYYCQELGGYLIPLDEQVKLNLLCEIAGLIKQEGK